MPRHPQQMRELATRGLAERDSLTIALASHVTTLLNEIEEHERDNDRLREKLAAAGLRERPTKEAALPQDPVDVAARILRDLHTLALMAQDEACPAVAFGELPGIYMATKGVERIHSRLLEKKGAARG